MKRSPSSYSSSSSDHTHDAKRPRTVQVLFSGLTVNVIQSKMGSTERDLLSSLAESNGASIQSSIRHADVIVTRIPTRKGLEQHIKWELVKEKAIVTPAWITLSVASQRRLPYGEYAAICTLEQCTQEHCPEHGNQASSSRPSSCSSSTPPPSSSKDLSYMSRFAVQRASPLVCLNQALLVQLDVIRNARALDGDERSAMSYSRAIAAIKAYPFPIKSSQQVSQLPYLGKKLLTMIDEYTSSKHISETTRLLKSTRYRSLAEFARIHGIGPHTARKLYDEGCRTLEDLDRRYGAELGRAEVDPMQEGETAGIRTMLELREDLSMTISRNEVEEIAHIVSQELEDLEPGCMHTICGGYRRGKPQCNDVDIIFTHPQSGKDRDLCKRLVERLQKRGLITHVLHRSSFRSSNPQHASVGASRQDQPHWDTLDKSLVVFLLPIEGVSSVPRLHRRVDLICSPIETYWTAVVGWTGSTLFERDLRLWAKQKMGLKFDSSGITRRRDTKAFYPTNERAVFEMLGLKWIDPTLRNADL